jgi:hypothetical protein
MNRDDIIRMAKEAGMALGFTQGIAVMNHKNLERFAALVAAAERKKLLVAAECCRMCEQKGVQHEQAKSNAPD